LLMPHVESRYMSNVIVYIKNDSGYEILKNG